MFHNLFDSHIHSDNSPDGHHSVMYLAERAKALGLMGIAITDHVECLHYMDHNFPTRITQSMVDAAKASAAFRYRMTLARGIELGVHPGDYAMAEQALELYPYDVVLGSCHITRDHLDYYDEIDYAALSQEGLSTLLEHYFEDVMELCRWGKFDVLSHLSMPFKRMAVNCGLMLDLTASREQIEEILRVLVYAGKALELNVSGLRSPLGDTLPPRWVIERFRALGGECVTLGSDAHRAEHVGEGIAEGMQMLKDVGFDFFAFYRARKPVMLRIV